MRSYKEISCNTCAHQEVCVYKDKFKAVREAVDELTVNLGDNRMIKLSDISWIKPVELKCGHFYEKITFREGGAIR